MVASAIGVMATGATALAVNLGMVGSSTVTRSAAVAGNASPVPTIVQYQDVYDLAPTTTIAAPASTTPTRATPVTTSRPAPTSPSTTVPTTVPAAPATTTPPVSAPTTTMPVKPPAAPSTTTTLPWWTSRLTVPGGARP